VGTFTFSFPRRPISVCGLERRGTLLGSIRGSKDAEPRRGEEEEVGTIWEQRMHPIPDLLRGRSKQTNKSKRGGYADLLIDSQITVHFLTGWKAKLGIADRSQGFQIQISDRHRDTIFRVLISNEVLGT
jgi:hypothetical protein